jgi:predicted component of type VI protein secretion system
LIALVLSLLAFLAALRRSYVIGSSLECDIQLVDASVMAEHAMLAHHRNGLAYLVDLGSDAGTSVDGIRLEPNALWRLKSGCSIVLGHAPALLLKGGQLLSHRELLRSARSSCGEQEGQGTAPKSRQNSELPSRKRSCAAVQEVMESTEETLLERMLVIARLLAFLFLVSNCADLLYNGCFVYCFTFL